MTHPRHLPDVYLLCRDLGHAWEVADVQRGQGMLQRGLICSRCGTHRQQAFTLASGQARPGPSRYRYPQGYLVPGGYSARQARYLLWARAGD